MHAPDGSTNGLASSPSAPCWPTSTETRMTSLNPALHNPHLDGRAFSHEAAGPNAVLLFHGFTATCAEVSHLGQVLHQAGFTTLGPLLPGHGETPDALNKVRWQDWIESAESAYQKLARRCQRVFIAGESNGALITLYLAAQHPEVVGLMAYAPALKLPLSRLMRWQIHLLAPFVASMPKHISSDDQVWQGYKVNPLKGVLQILRLQKEVLACLPRINQPILIVQGRQDQTIDPQSAQTIYDRVRSTEKELHWMEQSRHCVLLDQERDQVIRLTLQFVDRVLGAS